MTAARTHRTDVQIRFGDTDALGHINNAAYAQYAELARLDFLHHLGTRVSSLIIARLAIDFRRQVDFREPVHVESWVERMGRSSIGLRHAVYAAGELAADIESVVVVFDYEAGRSMEIPGELRDALAPFLAGAEAAAR